MAHTLHIVLVHVHVQPHLVESFRAATLTNAGVLTVMGGSQSDAGSVIDNGLIQDNASTLTVGTLTGIGQMLIGGGLLGLEAANGLRLRGMDVTVVHLADWIMERQLDKAAADLLKQSLEAKGLKFLLGKQTDELVAGESGRVAAIRFKDGEVIPADLVVMAVGIRPNTTLAESMGLVMGESGAIKVDFRQKTSREGIYAVGDCCEAFHKVPGKWVYFPLGDVANKQGRVAGQNAGGYAAEFPGIVGAQAFKVFNFPRS